MIKYREKGGYSSNPGENDDGLEYRGKCWNSVGVLKNGANGLDEWFERENSKSGFLVGAAE